MHKIMEEKLQDFVELAKILSHFSEKIESDKNDIEDELKFVLSKIEAINTYIGDTVSEIYNGRRQMMDLAYIMPIQNQIERLMNVCDILQSKIDAQKEMIQKFGIPEFQKEFLFICDDIEKIKKIIGYDSRYVELQEIEKKDLKHLKDITGVQLKEIADYFNVEMPTVSTWINKKCPPARKAELIAFFESKYSRIK